MLEMRWRDVRHGHDRYVARWVLRRYADDYQRLQLVADLQIDNAGHDTRGAREAEANQSERR